jgi:hypothetical protein
MDDMIDKLTAIIAKTALFISKWILPVGGVFIAYKLFAFFFITDWDKELLKGITKGDLGKVQTALKKGANVESKDKDECPAVVLAAKLNRSAIVSVLLAAGAKVDARDDGGRTAFIFACRKGYLDIVQVLLAKRADANVKCYDGTTGLIGAACKCIISAVYTELQAHACFFIIVKVGGFQEIVQLLLARNVDVSWKSKTGVNALIGTHIRIVT